MSLEGSMKRRDFIALLGGAGVEWPLAARAQQGERVRRIGVITGVAETDPDYQARYTALRQALEQLGWTDGRNIRFDLRLGGAGNIDLTRKHIGELVAFAPDVIVAAGSPTVSALQQATRTVPIVFVGIVDPVGAGFVASLARPGGNTTGFTSFEYGMSAKWLELLKQIDPRVTRAAVVRDPTNPASLGMMAAMQGVAPSLRMDMSPIDAREAPEIERAIAEFARGPHGGLIVTLTAFTIRHRGLISTLASRHRLPAVYPYRYFATGGGLISYGPDSVDQYRRAAGYVDRILKGEKAADLPVQAPTKYELVINLKTARALGLAVPDRLLATADEVIE
jgi:putative tryptophan/tyrosine transport system substrate-binding protein